MDLIDIKLFDELEKDMVMLTSIIIDRRLG